MLKSISATSLLEGDVIALPMGKTATVRKPPLIGTKYVSFSTEYGARRVSIYDTILLEVAEPDPDAVVTQVDLKSETHADHDIMVSYRQLSGWYIEGNTPSGWVCFESEATDDKDDIAIHLLKCGLHIDFVAKVLEDF